MKNKKLIIITVLLLILLLSMSLTYAYFTGVLDTDVGPNDITTTTGTLKLTYVDGQEISFESIYPGWSDSKELKITNTGSLLAVFDINFINLNNEIMNNELIYYATCTSYINYGQENQTEDGLCNSIEKTTIPYESGPLKSGIPISPGKTYVYDLTLTFLEISSAQNYNQGKSFSTLIKIDESSVTTKAKINDTAYNSLSLALNDVPNNSVETEITLLSTVIENNIISNNMNVILNLDNNYLSGTLTNNGTLTIDSGNIQNFSNINNIINNEGSTLTLNNVDLYNAYSTQSDNTIINYGILVINGGSYYKSGGGSTIINYSSGDVTINGASMRNESGTWPLIDNRGKVTVNENSSLNSYGGVTIDNKPNSITYINGGEINNYDSNRYAITNSSPSTLIVTGNANITSTNTTIYNSSNATVTIENGTITTNSTAPTIWNVENGTLNITDGTIGNTNSNGGGIIYNYGSTDILGGNIYNVGDQYYSILTGGTFNISGTTKITSSSTCIYVKENGILNFNDGEIEITKGVLGARVLSDGTFNMNGGTFKNTDDTGNTLLTNYGTVNIRGGSLYRTGHNQALLENNNIMTISRSAELSSLGEVIKNFSPAILNIEGGTLTANTSYNTIQNYSGSTLNVRDGIITNIGNGKSIWNAGTFNISNGSVYVNTSNDAVQNDNIFNMTGGTIYNSGTGLAISNNGGTCNVENGIIKNTNSTTGRVISNHNFGTFTISGTNTRILGKSSVLIENYATLSINGGEINNSKTDNAITIQNYRGGSTTINGGNIYGYSNFPTITTNNGGSLSINGGVITNSKNANAAYCNTDSTCTYTSGTCTPRNF